MRFASSVVALFLGSTTKIGRPSLLPPLVAAFATTRATFAAGQKRSYFFQTSSLSMSSESKFVRGEGNAFPSWSYDKPCDSMEWNPFAGDRISLQVTAEDADMESSDLVIVGIAPPPSDRKEEEEEEEGEVATPIELTGKAKEIDELTGGSLSQILSEQAKTFKNGAKLGDSTPLVRVVTSNEASAAKVSKYVFLGLGTNSTNVSSGGSKLGSAIASILSQKENNYMKKCTILLPSGTEVSKQFFSDVASSFYAAFYTDNRFKGLKKNAPNKAENLTMVSIHIPLLGDEKAAEEGILQGKAISKGVYMTKDVVNAPHNVLNSLGLADVARRIAKESGGKIKCNILSKKECEERGMGAFLGVARGSETEPLLIHLTYKPSGKVIKKVGIVGKGLLFDTGGYNIKTAIMELMKFDCGGSAAVLGAARAIGELCPEGVEAHFVVAACENMIGSKAYVPSDILTASNGLTIEIGNTDAEGRLTLADALVYTDKELGCESIIELSTLTGACMISLGKEVAGVWTSNDELAEEIKDISKTTGDKSWRMPLVEEYKELLKSKFADLSNVSSGKYGGAITAALFLQNFVSKKKPFAHIDIAGPVWDDKSGATGYGARLVTEWVTRQGKQQGEK